MTSVLPPGSSHFDHSKQVEPFVEKSLLPETKQKVSLLFSMIELFKNLEKSQSDISSSLSKLREKNIERLEESFTSLSSSLNRKSWNAIAAIAGQAFVLKTQGFLPESFFKQAILANRDNMVSLFKGFLDSNDDGMQASSQQLKALAEADIQSLDKQIHLASQAAEKRENLFSQWIQANTR